MQPHAQSVAQPPVPMPPRAAPAQPVEILYPGGGDPYEPAIKVGGFVSPTPATIHVQFCHGPANAEVCVPAEPIKVEVTSADGIWQAVIELPSGTNPETGTVKAWVEGYPPATVTVRRSADSVHKRTEVYVTPHPTPGHGACLTFAVPAPWGGTAACDQAVVILPRVVAGTPGRLYRYSEHYVANPGPRATFTFTNVTRGLYVVRFLFIDGFKEVAPVTKPYQVT